MRLNVYLLQDDRFVTVRIDQLCTYPSLKFVIYLEQPQKVRTQRLLHFWLLTYHPEGSEMNLNALNTPTII